MIAQPLQLQEVLGSNIRIPLSTLLDCIPNLRVDLAAWVANERKPPQEDVECDFIEERVDR